MPKSKFNLILPSFNVPHLPPVFLFIFENFQLVVLTKNNVIALVYRKFTSCFY